MRQIPASAGQRLLWMLEHYGGRAGLLNCPLLLRMRGPLDLGLLQAAIARLVARHEALRTTFVGRGAQLAQIVHDPGPVAMTVQDVAGSLDAGAELQRRIAAELQTQIDPTKSPVRVSVWRMSAVDHVVCINMHHLATDGWSCGVIFEELPRLYDGLAGGGAELPPTGWQYAQFAEWQAARARTRDFERHRDYWRRQLAGVVFPALLGREVTTHVTGRETAVLPAEAAARLREIARTRRTTLFAVLLSVYYILLWRLTGQSDLAAPTVFANRLTPELQTTVGALAHMIVLRTQLRRAVTVGDVLREAHATVAGAFLHQEVPYHLVGGVEAGAGSGRPDDLVFQLVARPLPAVAAGGVEVSAMELDGMGQRFGFECAVFPIGGGLTLAASYNQARATPAFAREFVTQFAAIAAQVARQPEARLAAVAA